MKRSGLGAKAAAALAAERIRGVVPEAVEAGLDVGEGGDLVVLDTPLARAADVAAHLRAAAPKRQMAVNPRRPLADLFPVPAPAPALIYRPTTRAIDGSNRLWVRLDTACGKAGLSEVLGWEPGPLTVAHDGDWQVLTPDRSGRPAERNDGRCTFSADGRLRLSLAVMDALQVRPADEVMVLVLPEHGAVALCPTTALLTGAPLSLLTETTCTCNERNPNAH